MRTDLSILRERSFLLLFSARSISLLGNAIAPVATAFAVLGMPGGSGSMLGLVLAARLISQVVFLLFGGVLADRLPRNRVMISADLAAGLSQGAAAFLVLTGSASALRLAVLAVVSGGATAMFTPASRALAIQLVPPEKIQPANALVQLSMNAGSICGAAAAGALVTVFGPGWALAVDAASFLVSATLLSGIRLRRQHDEQPATGNMLDQLKDGWREFTARQWVWVMVCQLALANVCIAGGFSVLGPIVATDHLGGASAWATVLTAQAIGFAVGSLIALHLRPRRPVRAAALFTLGFVPPFICLAGAAPVRVIAPAMFVTGMCVSLYDVTFQTALQKHIPPESMSRVMSYDSFGSFVFMPLGLAVAAPLADLAGIGTTLVAGGSVIALTSLFLLTLPSVKGVRDESRRPAQPPLQPADGPGPSAPSARRQPRRL
ncbi:MFS transporter [Streptomyces sp. NPDC051105]|uniref:MFS transporter n=1 Tax=Streptomyces sp. NPDC051105 TaxID=3154843 RepID=UPI00342B3963